MLTEDMLTATFIAQRETLEGLYYLTLSSLYKAEFTHTNTHTHTPGLWLVSIAIKEAISCLHIVCQIVNL